MRKIMMTMRNVRIGDHRENDLPFRGYPRKDRLVSVVMGSPFSEGLPDAVLIESLYMVASGLRCASFLHPRDIQEVLQLREACNALGMGFAVRKVGDRVLKVFMYGEEKGDFIDGIPDIEGDLGDKEFIMGQIAVANMTGIVLDYPECCRMRFVRHLMEATDQDMEATLALRRAEEPDPDAYYVERFVPCRPDCPGAIGRGRSLESGLRALDEELARRYRGLKASHMTDVREGTISKEKEIRDRQL